MITILEHGNVEEPKITTCDECGCTFSFTREDCYWSRPCLTYKIECPECKAKLWLGDIYDK